MADLPSASDYSDLDTPAGSPGIVSRAYILYNYNLGSLVCSRILFNIVRQHHILLNFIYNKVKKMFFLYSNAKLKNSLISFDSPPISKKPRIKLILYQPSRLCALRIKITL